MRSYKNIKHRIPEKDKYAKDSEWARNIMEALIPSYSNNAEFHAEYIEKLSNYKLMNNVLDQEEFVRFCNPLGIDVDQYAEEVMPYNKTPNKINVLLGEELKRGDSYKPILLNQRALRRKDEERKEAYIEYAMMEMEKELLKVQVQLQQMSPEEAQQRVMEMQQEYIPKSLEESEFLSEQEILGSQIIDYSMYDQNVKAKKNDAFKHGLLSGGEFVYVGIERGKPVIQNINSLHMIHQKSLEVKYVQDGDWAGHRVAMTVGRAIDLYSDRLKEEDIKKLEERYGRIHGTNSTNRTNKITTDWRQSEGQQFLDRGYYHTGTTEAVGAYGTREFNYSNFYNELIWVTHMEWRSQRRVGFLTYYNEYGERVKEIVDDSYPIPANAEKIRITKDNGDKDYKYTWIDINNQEMEISYSYIPRIWEGTRIDDDIYVDLREKPNQVTSIDDPFHRTKLGYYGLTYTNMNVKSVSVMSRMKPFQFLYFSVMHQFTELLTRNYGKILEYDLAQVPQELGKDGKDPMEMLLYFQRKGYSFYNSMENSEGSPAALHSRGAASGVADLSVTGDLINLANIADWLDRQIGEAAGISKEREGSISPNTNVTDNQQAITQSSHITEIYFHLHNELWKHVMEGYLTTFKMWAKKFLEENEDRDEHILSYILPNEGKATLRISSDKLEDVDLGIFTTYSGQEQEYFNKLESYLLPLVSTQGAGAKEISYILKARSQGTSPEEIHKMIVELDNDRQAREEQMQQAQLENAQQLQQAELEAREDEQAHELDKIILAEEEKRKTLEVEGRIKATIEALSYAENKDADNDGVPDVLEVAKHGLNAHIETSKLDLEKQKLEFEKEKTKRDQDIKEKEIKAKAKQSKSSSK